MRRFLLISIAGLVAGAAASASAAGPVRVRVNEHGEVCYYSDAIPMMEQCRSVDVYTEPVKVDVRGDEVCAWAFSLPQECVQRP